MQGTNKPSGQERSNLYCSDVMAVPGFRHWGGGGGGGGGGGHRGVGDVVC